MADANKILKEIQRLEKEAYQQGWHDAVAKILATASDGVPVNKRPASASRLPAVKSNLKPDIPIIEVIHGIIKERPGLRGVDVFREAVIRKPGSNLTTMDRTGRTALKRLKERGQIMQRSKRWYPKKGIENETPAVGSLAL